tara:strand:- start:272 stop:856 length:585 start_codon:yes stop_codon:yes gene_type:complete
MKMPNYLRKRKGTLELKINKRWIKWNPFHSKLSAYLLGGGEYWPFNKNSKILYLGAAEGNTLSFLSEICTNNTIAAVEISEIAMAELLELVEKKKNIIPYLGDAHFPNKYHIQANKPEIIYQDIAQNDQIDIFLRNCNYFNPKYAFLMLKTQSISKKKTGIIEYTENKLKEKFQIVESINIKKWAKGHTAYYME